MKTIFLFTLMIFTLFLPVHFSEAGPLSNVDYVLTEEHETHPENF